MIVFLSALLLLVNALLGVVMNIKTMTATILVTILSIIVNIGFMIFAESFGITVGLPLTLGILILFAFGIISGMTYSQRYF
ncbi:MAG: hypothetical protein UW68_C0006G0002 [Candidatus Collierbacteria bacterium GW2011_GWB1_44_6]|nr:MAG: hypothetical protein UW68_C0006G0002 [Candidatus Collierbacteria bacterium GW2011_GWB1_44_6]KKT83013.1 MAG: hypothetical protein UW80_C0024G0004 [Microgenomates group bacterium GW2011_GWC1_44_9]